MEQDNEYNIISTSFIPSTRIEYPQIPDRRFTVGYRHDKKNPIKIGCIIDLEFQLEKKSPEPLWKGDVAYLYGFGDFIVYVSTDTSLTLKSINLSIDIPLNSKRVLIPNKIKLDVLFSAYLEGMS